MICKIADSVKNLMSKKPCTLYWIRLPEHTDILSQGYIGITNLGTRKRYKIHLQNAKNHKKQDTLQRAIRKYGDKLVVSTILTGSREMCLVLENTLRPRFNVGWNIAIGGKAPLLGRKRNPESVKRGALKRTGRKASLEQIEANRQRGIEQFRFENAWEHPKCNKYVWACADFAFKIYKEEKTFGRRTFSKRLNVGVDSVVKLVNKIKAGWNPNEDSVWIEFKNNFVKENDGTYIIPNC